MHVHVCVYGSREVGASDHDSGSLTLVHVRMIQEAYLI